MIRTRDFVVFSGALVFLFAMITATVLTDALSGGSSHVANVSLALAPESKVSGASLVGITDDRESTIARLRAKLAAGEGDISAGEPVFTSVDDYVATSADAIITDQTIPTSVLIGHTLDGQPLLSSDLWRYVGFSQFDQIGTAQNGVPIYGSRADTFMLDTCGGAEEGQGYRLYVRPSENVNPACYGS